MPMINIEDAYILDETGAQVDQVTGLYFKNENASDTEKAQARANIGAGGSNRNLLDNAYFVGGGSQLGDGVFPINQRGQTSYTGNTYTIDRWVISSSAITVTLNAGYIELSGTAGNNFSQVIAPETAKALYGKTVTVSALMYDGTILTGTGIFPTRPASSWNFVGFVYGTDAALIIGTSELYRSEFFIQTQSASAKVCAVKLELGTVSTLANDPPPNFFDEKKRCQSYLWHKTFGGNTQIGCGPAVDASTVIIDVVVPASMRATPTVAFTASVLLVGNGGVVVAPSVIGINEYDNHLRLVVSATGLTAYQVYSLLTTTTTTMTVSAEL